MKSALLFIVAVALTGCGGGGIANRSAGNISIHTGDRATITLSRMEATQAADKSIDAGKVAASAAQAQGGDATGGTATVTTPNTPAE